MTYPKIHQDHRGYAVALGPNGPWICVGDTVCGSNDELFLLSAGKLDSYYYETLQSANAALRRYLYRKEHGLHIRNGQEMWTNI